MAFQNQCISCMPRAMPRAMHWPHNHSNVNSVFQINYSNGSAIQLKSFCNGFTMVLQWLHKYEAIASCTTSTTFCSWVEGLDQRVWARNQGALPMRSSPRGGSSPRLEVQGKAA